MRGPGSACFQPPSYSLLVLGGNVPPTFFAFEFIPIPPFAYGFTLSEVSNKGERGNPISIHWHPDVHEDLLTLSQWFSITQLPNGSITFTQGHDRFARNLTAYGLVLFECLLFPACPVFKNGGRNNTRLYFERECCVVLK